MIKANELRIGNWVSIPECGIVSSIKTIDSKRFAINIDNVDLSPGEDIFNYESAIGIPLTPEILEKCGFEQLPHFTVQNNWFKKIGRDRVVSVACVGTPNEMVFINEEVPPEVKNIIVARNYDYDGKTYLHQLQNLIFALTGEELTVNL